MNGPHRSCKIEVGINYNQGWRLGHAATTKAGASVGGFGHMDAIAGYDDEDEEEAPEVTLDIGGGQEITSAAWCDLPEEQADENWKPALDDKSWVAMMKPNEVVAFYDRVALDGATLASQ